MKRVDLTGKRFGRLAVIGYAGTAPNGNACWQCRCDCGNSVTIDGYRLRRGVTTSSGCYRKEVMRQRIRDNAKTAAHIGDVSSLNIRDHVNIAAITKLSKKNTSGVVGVSFDQNTQTWLARMVFQRKLVLNKHFVTFKEAVNARKGAEARYLQPLLAKLDQQCAPSDQETR